MEYQKLAELYDYIEKHPARLKKIDAIAKVFRECDDDTLPMLAIMVQGKLFPSWKEDVAGFVKE